jgi:AbrB family looped-hinge helix DNA binding protein
MKLTSRVTSKGQVTIPRQIREKYGLLPHTMVEFLIEPQGPRLKRAKTKQTRGAQIVARMRQSHWKSRMRTDEIMKLLRGDSE